ncbi:MAG: hypothetical protein A2033_10625 [Bacteroidetes bacterium GWA2_31_9]|nr:MAG: hypothetical protein A2033_10625 [Bacteroidetes bacterium GWA2_31_9]
MKNRIFIGVTLISFMMSCSNGNPKSNNSETTNADIVTTIEVNSDQFGEEWPLTVKNGKLSCVQYYQKGINPKEVQGVIFETNGKTYSLNGIADSYKKKYNYSDVEEIWLFDDKMVDDLVKQGLSKEEAMKVRTRKTIAPLIDKGLSICSK